VCIVDHDGKVVFDKNLAGGPYSLLRAIAPFRDGLVIGALHVRVVLESPLTCNQ
jgi:hypothetical protein